MWIGSLTNKHTTSYSDVNSSPATHLKCYRCMLHNDEDYACHNQTANIARRVRGVVLAAMDSYIRRARGVVLAVMNSYIIVNYRLKKCHRC